MKCGWLWTLIGHHTAGMQSRQTFVFCNKCGPKRDILLSDFYQIWQWERVPDVLPHAKFHRCHFRIVSKPPKSLQIGNFWYARWSKSPEHFLNNNLASGRESPLPHQISPLWQWKCVCLRTRWRCGENFVSPHCSVSVRLTHYSERGTIAINRVVTSLVG